MNDRAFEKNFNQLFVPTMQAAVSPPLLAHYTSIRVMEAIFQTNEIWLYRLFMNDLQEVRFGLREGQRLLPLD